MMEFMDGVKKKETLGIGQILEGDYTGKTVEMEGAVHTIRDMGEVAFVILRKAEGLVQCVFEEGVTEFDLKDLKEESAVVITGVVAREDRAPHGFEIRLRKIKVLSQPAEILPIAISKYKMNTSLETKLDLRPLSLRNVRESQVPCAGGNRAGIQRLSSQPGIYRDPFSQDRSQRSRGRC